MGFVDAVTLQAPASMRRGLVVSYASQFGMDAVEHQLGSDQDANFLMRSPGGEPMAVLKVSNSAFSASLVSYRTMPPTG